jgi:hypothetical protein
MGVFPKSEPSRCDSGGLTVAKLPGLLRKES